ncbi:MAG: type II toxin-antitoxin system antitoxin, RelB/DinJ family [Oscillospiraceae bacterium]|nr:type II toxin-antitoxin system antitoxin, RelB/DinJ family [Oscillospiraceae bacterium]MDD7429409.1 type II toxin-antitoxin system antitoxin, RelB/DinJ family [Oscillospiraceae bacterium]MDY2847211.1 type II toxin-antitoxin system antitoxin, RelB/DinJ family [Oscillospiraceae bacterium]
MSTKELAYTLIDSMTEAQLQALVNFIKSFSLGLDETPNAETIAVINDVNNGKNLIGPFSSVEELMEDLNADD